MFKRSAENGTKLRCFIRHRKTGDGAF